MLKIELFFKLLIKKTLKYLFVILAIFMMYNLRAQEEKPKNKYEDPQNMDVVYNSDAKYPGGDIAFYQYIAENLHYPQAAKDKKLKGEILISFDVEIDGSLSGFTIISGLGYGVDEALIEVLKKMKFEAAIMNGTKVKMNTMYAIPIYAGPGAL